MNRAYVFAALAYLVPTFPLGFVWHLVTFAEQYRQLELYREEVIIPLGVSSMAIQCVLFAWAYPKLFDTRRDAWVKSAVGFGLFAGVLAWSFTTLPVAAKYKMTSVPQFLLLETGFTVLQFAIVSPLIALAHRRPA